MRMRNLVATLGVAALALTVGACGKDGEPAAGGGGGSTTGDCGELHKFDVATGVDVPGSATFAKIKARGNAVVGVKADQPNLGYKDANGKRCGFDIEIARMVSAQLGFDPEKIEYKEIPSANRETAIAGGEIDYYVGTYSITDKRKKLVSFAGPYFIAGQDLLVRKDDTSMDAGKDGLKGKKVCSATGSTPIQKVKDEGLTEPNNISEFKTYSECVSQLLDNKTDAVTTDDAILKGYAANAPDELRVVGKPFSTEKYGIGLPLADKALRDKVNAGLEASFTDGTWKAVYDETLGKSGSAGTPPQLEKY
ncbi:extracellular solute-binding protein family 3 [Kribbella flavida DSM 17836]|uniref:Extracellular solute-binding protein family 3 n=1 Tax=Kribbella flavida (strain DSM 17836 / JCM 10339 / NBRC 14399) TaxID=479435 RepID=D2PZD7_KRIFD|nr:glutamate ABC transporter substrate-binding protein [Kribbella flavida]ADB33746.1 extracellular solute-binding protein family 3 [Kribbella flavida DSM 17836]